MRKIKILFLFCLCSAFAVAQNDCSSALNGFTNPAAVIPPIGTVASAGPNYGCLTITSRQVWYYFPVCETVSESYIEYHTWGIDDIVGMILYGPFINKVTNCADLNSAKIMACNESNSGFNSLLVGDSLYEGNYYYLVLTHNDSVLNPPPFVSLDNYPTHYCFQCNNQPSVNYLQNFCYLSVDTTINKCVMTWQEFPGTNLLGYKINRESTVTGVYDSVTTIPVGSPSTFTDMTSSPVQHNYSYAVTGVDSCGNSYPVAWNSSLSTIHLLSFPGANNQAQLIWNNIYPQGTFAPQYFIHRNTNGGGWQLIDSIGISLPTITYTDIFAPAGTNQYAVELHQLVACNPMRSTSAYQSVFSNISTALVTGFENLTNNPRLTISPNPAKENFEIDLSYLNTKQSDITIYDLQGRIILNQKNISDKRVSVSAEKMQKGVYVVEIANEKLYRTKLVLD